MKSRKKLSNKYYFSVEGQTEKLYFLWLQKQINAETNSRYTVNLYPKIEKSPCSMVKSLVNIYDTTIYHIIDKESESTEHTKNFKQALDNMCKAESLQSGITYELGYSNFTFDLWILLHKGDCYASKVHRKQYLDDINRLFGTAYHSMDEYKEEKNFKELLCCLSLSDVFTALNRAKHIQKECEAQEKEKTYRKFKYYTRNPSLSIDRIVADILKDCGLIR